MWEAPTMFSEILWFPFLGVLKSLINLNLCKGPEVMSRLEENAEKPIFFLSHYFTGMKFFQTLVVSYWSRKMDVAKTFVLILLFLIRVFSFSSLYIIWTYLRNKSPAMQTLKDEMMTEIIWSSVLMTTSVDLVWIRLRSN